MTLCQVLPRYKHLGTFFIYIKYSLTYAEYNVTMTGPIFLFEVHLRFLKHSFLRTLYSFNAFHNSHFFESYSLSKEGLEHLSYTHDLPFMTHYKTVCIVFHKIVIISLKHKHKHEQLCY